MGIMKKHWTASDFPQIETSRLSFTELDVEFIQEGIDYRLGER
jgi:hypothetical protein